MCITYLSRDSCRNLICKNLGADPARGRPDWLVYAERGRGGHDPAAVKDGLIGTRYSLAGVYGNGSKKKLWLSPKNNNITLAVRVIFGHRCQYCADSQGYPAGRLKLR